MPLNEVMALYGLDGYRRLESQALDKIVNAHDRLVLAVAGGIGGAVSGAGTEANNSIGGDTSARIEGLSTVIAATTVSVIADDDGTMDAVIVATAVAGGLGGASVGIVLAP